MHSLPQSSFPGSGRPWRVLSGTSTPEGHLPNFGRQRGVQAPGIATPLPEHKAGRHPDWVTPRLPVSELPQPADVDGVHFLEVESVAVVVLGQPT